MITLIKIVCVNINDLTINQGKTTERKEGSNETEGEQDLEKYGRSRRRRRRGILKHAALKVCHGLHQQRSCLVLTFLQIDEVLQVCNRPEGSRLPLPSPPSLPSPLPSPILSSAFPLLHFPIPSALPFLFPYHSSLLPFLSSLHSSPALPLLPSLYPLLSSTPTLLVSLSILSFLISFLHRSPYPFHVLTTSVFVSVYISSTFSSLPLHFFLLPFLLYPISLNSCSFFNSHVFYIFFTSFYK